jgi:hypothetical protein
VVSAPKPSTSTGSKRKKGQKQNAKSKKTLPRIHAGHYAPDDFNALSEEEKAEVKRLRLAKKQASGATKIGAVNTTRNVSFADAKHPPTTSTLTDPETPSGTADSSLSSRISWRDRRKDLPVLPTTTVVPGVKVVGSWKVPTNDNSDKVIVNPGVVGTVVGSWRDKPQAAWYQKAVSLSDPPQAEDPGTKPPANDPITTATAPPQTEDSDAKPSAVDPIILASVSVSVPTLIPTTTQEPAVDPTTVVHPTSTSACISVASTAVTLPTKVTSPPPPNDIIRRKPRRKPKGRKVEPPAEPVVTAEGDHEWGTNIFSPPRNSEEYRTRRTTLPAPVKLVNFMKHHNVTAVYPRTDAEIL